MTLVQIPEAAITILRKKFSFSISDQKSLFQAGDVSADGKYEAHDTCLPSMTLTNGEESFTTICFGHTATVTINDISGQIFVTCVGDNCEDNALRIAWLLCLQNSLPAKSQIMARLRA